MEVLSRLFFLKYLAEPLDEWTSFGLQYLSIVVHGIYPRRNETRYGRLDSYHDRRISSCIVIDVKALQGFF